jgi:ssDNA-binding Zn-finger/Zn-ribbon topoisomerase 1
MVMRSARKGKSSGARFWGCAAYPDCKGTRSAEGQDDRSDPTDPSDDNRG